MPNNILLLNSIINLYKETIAFYLTENLNEQIIQTLANMLALHYSQKNNENPSHKEYAAICCDKLKKCLQRRIITETDFTIALELFAIAIAEDFTNEQDLLANQKQAIIDQIASELGDAAENADFIAFIDFALSHKDSEKIINYITSRKKRAIEIISKSLVANPSLKKNNIYNELGTLFAQEATNSQPSLFSTAVKTTYSLITSVGLIYASITAFSILAPLGLIPVAAFSFKTFSKQADIISSYLTTQTSKLLEHDNDIPQKIQKITELAKGKQNTINISASSLKEASTLLGTIGPLQDTTIIKVKKEHTKEVILQAEAIKKKIDSHQY